MPVLIVAFILAEEKQVSFYREGIFQVELKDIDVEFLAKNPEHTSIRWIGHTEMSDAWLSKLATISEEFSNSSTEHALTPINIARGLVSIYERLPQWTVRTNSLSSEVIKLRSLFKHAFDPNQLLFNDLMNTEAFKSIQGIEFAVRNLQQNINELVNAYPRMLDRIRRNLLKRLYVTDTTERCLEQLRDRAKNILQLSGEFRLEAFITRLTNYQNTDEDIEGLASLAVNKLPKSWADGDYDKANLSIVELTRNFVKLETFADVKGRKNKRQAMAIVFGVNDEKSPIIYDFDISESEHEQVNDLVDQLTEVLNEDGMSDNVALAALAVVSERYAKG